MIKEATPADLKAADAIASTFNLFDFNSKDWASRDLASKTVMVIRDAADRLEGMATVLFGMAMQQRMGGGHNAGEFVFLAKTTKDIARVMRSLDTLCRADMNAEDRRVLKIASATKRKPKGKPRSGSRP